MKTRKPNQTAPPRKARQGLGSRLETNKAIKHVLAVHMLRFWPGTEMKARLQVKILGGRYL